MSYQCGTVSITYKNIIVSQNFFWEGEKKTLSVSHVKLKYKNDKSY